MNQQYTEQEAEAILRLAVRQSGETISRDRLMAMASEFGRLAVNATQGFA